ncbi:hypothetical protein EJB05_39822 [Eragrostis curvula]|uniref:MICOS complex subunit MIC60 n=1 Tax=Eragrostis curvula TaxID=38414 RepID=A0A5J9TY17_9POAL|nr:hypothetical protein EJB05_39822 [Eragrostis curvula]
MLRRCVRDLPALRSLTRVPRPISGEVRSPAFIGSRSKSTNASQKSSAQNTAPGPQEEPSKSRSNVSRLVLGTLVVGAATMGAYQAGYIDLQFKDMKLPFSIKKQDDLKMNEALKAPSEEKVEQKQTMSEPNVVIVQETDKEAFAPKNVSDEVVNNPETPTEQSIPAEEKEAKTLDHNIHSVPDEHGSDIEKPLQDTPAVEIKPLVADDKVIDESPHKEQIDSMVSPVQSSPTTVKPHHDSLAVADELKDTSGADAVEHKSLADTYLLQDEPDVSKDVKQSAKETKTDDVVHKKTSEDGKIVLDIIEAIHAAEKKQADADAYMFSEEKRKLKEKYEKELKDTRARELMYAEEAAILDKELKKEKMKHAAAIKELQEKAEQKLRDELHMKEEETSQQIEKLQELAKAELAAAVAKEKASQLEQIAEANLNFNSLKETIRHFSLIPSGGGGILTHAVARVASSLKIKEDTSGDGIESVINRVESLIVDGDLSTAADTLEGGLHGSEAEEIATEWVKQARKRAVAEQTLRLLHACASSITSA